VASQKHKLLLINDLNKIDLSLKAMLKEMIASINIVKDTIIVRNEDVPPRCPEHNNTLYLSMICLQKYIPLALVHDGLALNVCPWRTTNRLGIKEGQLFTTLTHLRAYDNSKGTGVVYHVSPY